MVTFSAGIDPIMQDILFDPQTSGGLLIGVKDMLAQGLLEELRAKGVLHAAVIGNVTDGPAGRIMVA